MVLNNVVDAAAIDSNVLQLWMSEHHEHAAELHIMCSWGPWPVQPIVVNTRLPGILHIKATIDSCNVLSEHNTVFVSKRTAICNRYFPGPTRVLDAKAKNAPYLRSIFTGGLASDKGPNSTRAVSP